MPAMFKVIAGTMSASQLEEQIKQLQRGFATPVRDAPGAEAGQRLKEAVRQRVQGIRRGGSFASLRASSDDGSLGRKLADATKRLVASHPRSVKQAREQAERNKARYHKPQRRKPTRSD